MPPEMTVNAPSQETGNEPVAGQQAPPAEPAAFPLIEPAYRRRPRVNWPAVIFGVLAAVALMISAWVLFLAPPDRRADEGVPGFVLPASPTSSATPTPAATPRANGLTFLEPTLTPTPVPGGRVLVLTPAPEDAGWVVSDDESVVTIYDPQNHFGDSYLYAGVLDGKVYHAAFQFDLSRIPRGTKIYAASLHLTGLRSDQLAEGKRGEWRLQLLGSDIDYYWRSANYQQIHNATVQVTFEPPLTQAQLGAEQVNVFELTPKQLALLEQRLIEGGDQLGRKVSFRLDGPMQGGDNLFAWDSGAGPGSKGTGPELFLSLGPPPQETPPPYYVVITSTPTPENIATALANSLRLTAEATRVGTPTPLPPHWVTPFVVTVTPTPQNQATTQWMAFWATATAVAGGPPPNMMTATPTPTHMIVTSTPTPENVMTAAAISLQMTAEATRIGTATPLPTNWVTPVVVTSMPTPANTATLEYWQAVMLTTGTPTPTPANLQTATPTPVFILLTSELPTPAPTPTPTPTPQFIPSELVGKIAFLSDRAYHTNARTERAEGEEALPLGEPLVYVIDPDGGNLALLTERWPYDLALERDAFSSDQRFRVFVKDAIIDTGRTNALGGVVPIQIRLPALFFYDFFYEVEDQITHFGAGIAYDPAWSPTAEQIAFVSNDSSNDEIWIINRDGSGALQLTRDEYNWWDKHPSWSPDGSKIVFWSNRTGNRQIWVMDADGSNLYSLSRTGFNDWDPVWIKYTDPPRPLPTPPPRKQSGR
jgi:hypothetical protein